LRKDVRVNAAQRQRAECTKDGKRDGKDDDTAPGLRHPSSTASCLYARGCRGLWSHSIAISPGVFSGH
jgi:hypothetical protein